LAVLTSSIDFFHIFISPLKVTMKLSLPVLGYREHRRFRKQNGLK